MAEECTWKCKYILCSQMDDLQFYIMSVVMGCWEADCERLCAMEPHLWLNGLPLPLVIKLWTMKSASDPSINHLYTALNW